MIRINLARGKLTPAHREPIPLELELEMAFIAERDARKAPAGPEHKGLWARFKRKQYRKAPFLAWAMRLGFTLRVNNNARAVLGLIIAALWFFANVITLVVNFALASEPTDERLYNFAEYGVRATNLEMASWPTWFLTKFWSVVSFLFVNPWSWIFNLLFIVASIVYLLVALREELAEAAEGVREKIAQRSTIDLPDQPSGQPSTPQTPMSTGAGIVGNFLKKRAQFALEDLTWEGIQKIGLRGLSALRGG